MEKYNELLVSTIKESVDDVLKRLPELEPQDRYSLIMEWIEVIADDIDVDDVVVTPLW